MASDQILVKTLKGEKTQRPAFWFMRQAGRYLPEYRAIREKQKDFLKFCYTPEAAVEVTLQPIERFGMDAAIIFSDILVVPHALGANVWFEQGHGPRIDPVRSEAQLSALSTGRQTDFLAPVYEALRRTRESLAKDKALIGFCGSPWTLACYMLQGSSSKDFAAARDIAQSQPEFFKALMDLLVEAVSMHALEQVRAGADVIQLFDSWAGVLTETQFADYVIAPTQRIVSLIRKAYPELPIIGFPRQAGIKYLSFAQQTEVNAVSFDNTVPLEWVKHKLQAEVVVQGCLDNELLAGDKEGMLDAAREIIRVLGNKAFVFNLGHGILPHTPPEHVGALCELIKNSRIEA